MVRRAQADRKQFLADDCTGLSQQVAFGSLLAFFPSVILLVGLLGLIGAYEDLKIFLGTVAPGAVIDAIDLAQETAAGNKATSTVAVVIGTFLAVWAASGAMNAVIKAVNVAYDRIETRPFWKVRIYAIVLVFATGLTLAGLFVLIVFGGPLGEAIASRADLGGAWDWAWNIVRWPLAFCARAALLRARLLRRAERRPAQLEVGHAGLARRGRSSGSCSRVSSRSTRASRRRTTRPMARSRAGSSCCSG